MAVPSNRSSSPIPGRPNPNARSSEFGNPMRRSFTENPSIVPNHISNSPSEFLSGKSLSRESVESMRDNEDKENKENGKMVRVRSSMVSKGISDGIEGSKDFMSPTSCAASKMNASPRKEILKERNEPVHVSVSCGQEISDSSNQRKEEGGEESPMVSADSKAKSDSKPKKTVFVESEPSFREPNLKISPPPPPVCSSSPSIAVIAPLDSDPLAPSYDPETNYLLPRPRFRLYKPRPQIELNLSKPKAEKRLENSFVSGSSSDSYSCKTKYLLPRPLFLYYKPNRRIELNLRKTKEENQLEDSFVSGSFSVPDPTEEEAAPSESSPKESEDGVSFGEEEAALSESSLKESEDDESFDEEVGAEGKHEEEEGEEELIVSESCPNKTNEAKFGKSKIGVLLMLSVACLTLFKVSRLFK